MYDKRSERSKAMDQARSNKDLIKGDSVDRRVNPSNVDWEGIDDPADNSTMLDGMLKPYLDEINKTVSKPVKHRNEKRINELTRIAEKEKKAEGSVSSETYRAVLRLRRNLSDDEFTRILYEEQEDGTRLQPFDKVTRFIPYSKWGDFKRQIRDKGTEIVPVDDMGIATNHKGAYFVFDRVSVDPRYWHFVVTDSVEDVKGIYRFDTGKESPIFVAKGTGVFAIAPVKHLRDKGWEFEAWRYNPQNDYDRLRAEKIINGKRDGYYSTIYPNLGYAKSLPEKWKDQMKKGYSTYSAKDVAKTKGGVIIDDRFVSKQVWDIIRKKEKIEKVYKLENSPVILVKKENGWFATVAKVDKPKERYPVAKPEDISRDIIVRAYQNTSQRPEQYVDLDRGEYTASVNGLYTDLISKAEPNRREDIRVDVEKYRKEYLKRKLELLRRNSQIASTLVTGRANFPVEKMRSKREILQRKKMEFATWQNKQKARLVKKYTGEGNVMANDDLASDKLKDKLSKRVIEHDRMKKANKILRSNASDKEKELSKLGFEGLEEPFQSYRISNSNAEIRRLKRRIREIEDREDRVKVGDARELISQKGNVRVIRDNEADRVRIYFDSKPPEDMRKRLKSKGFRWSPKAGAWQRKISNQAIYVAKELVKDEE